ncbi:hypothetical protein K8P10_001035 [Leucobacter sp. Psy1]|nr:hypothetical protein K8P10_001035 [Leucobacter sp. Psy1]
MHEVSILRRGIGDTCPSLAGATSPGTCPIGTLTEHSVGIEDDLTEGDVLVRTGLGSHVR